MNAFRFPIRVTYRVVVITLCFLLLSVPNLTRAGGSIYDTYISRFYQISHETILSFERNASELENIEIDPYMPPKIGVFPMEPYVLPTKVSTNGLHALFRGNLTYAELAAEWLIENSVISNDMMFIPHTYMYRPKYPYYLQPPWNSAISQGLSLELMVQLYAVTGDENYANYAGMIANSYQLAIDDGGFTRYVDGYPVFEEYPTTELTGVFNGYALAALALKSYADIFEDIDAQHLFDQSISWLERTIPRLESDNVNTNQNYPPLLTRYSFLDPREEVLFRFVNIEGNPFINRIEFVSDTEINQLDVGSDESDNNLNTAYIWYNPEYQTWGAPDNLDGVSGRYLNDNLTATYGHAPFSVVVPENPQSPRLRISLLGQNGNSFQIQVLSSGSYHFIQEVILDETPQTVVEIGIPEELLSFESIGLSGERVQPEYVDDNHQLLQLIAEAADSDILRFYARRWDRDWINTMDDINQSYWINVDNRAIMYPFSASNALTLPTSFVSGSNPNPATIMHNNLYETFFVCSGVDRTTEQICTTSSTDINALLQVDDPIFETNNEILDLEVTNENGIHVFIRTIDDMNNHAIYHVQSLNGENFEETIISTEHLEAFDFTFDTLSGLWFGMSISNVIGDIYSLNTSFGDSLQTLSHAQEVDTQNLSGETINNIFHFPVNDDFILIGWETSERISFYYLSLAKKLSAYAGEVFKPANVEGFPQQIRYISNGQFIGILNSPESITFVELDQEVLYARLLEPEEAFRISTLSEYQHSTVNP